MREYKRLTNEELNDFTSRVVVQLEPTLTQQIISLILELTEYRTKIKNGTLIEVDNKVYPPNKSIGVWGDYCSKCGGLIGENGYEENYCSHCGAKLKE